jgi:chemotaxis-related protein WspB
MLALTFQIGSDRVALDVRRVRRVVPRVKLAPAPPGARGLAGQFVYRGQVVPVVDFFQLAGAGECPARLSSRIVLVPRADDPERLVGLLATQVADIRELPVPPASVDAPFGLGPPVADGAAMLRHLDVDRLLAALNLEPALLSVPGGAGS